MKSKKLLNSMFIVVAMSSCAQIAQAGLLESLCSWFSRPIEFAKQRPVIASLAILGSAAVCGGLFWWYKTRAPKNVKSSSCEKAVAQTPKQNQESLAKKRFLDRAICQYTLAIARFDNTKQLLSAYETADSQLFYAELSAFLPQIRSSLIKQEHINAFDNLGLDRAENGSYEYWNSCAQLYFHLDTVKKYAQESLARVQKLRAELV